MASQHDSELAQFHDFVGQQLTGSPQLTPEEALDLWRASHPQGDDYEETILALRESLADLEAGNRGQPADEFFRELRKRRGWKS